VKKCIKKGAIARLLFKIQGRLSEGYGMMVEESYC